MGYARRLHVEFHARMSHSPPLPPPPALRWIACANRALATPVWLQQQRAAGAKVIVSPWRLGQNDLNALDAWARQVRALQVVAAVAVPVPAAHDLPLADLDALGPLLVVLVPESADDLTHWPHLRAFLAQTRYAKLRWTSLGVPRCHADPWLPDVLLAPAQQRAMQPGCETCGARETCPRPLPQQNVTALPVAVSNQFDLTDAPPDRALLHLQAKPERHFALQQPHSAVVDEALARGQLYLDRSDKARLDDFAADLALLIPAGANAWRLADAQPFAAEESLLLGHLRTLRGVVVDVGAGPIRYVQELAQAQSAGSLRYLAVEPDLAALERTVTVLPDALCLQGTGEHLPVQTASADTVLMLRSFNHLRDVPQAMREVARVLKPGGAFLACDNVAFGLCRSPEQLARAHAIPVTETPFEHYRNADAPDAAVALHAAVPDGFRVDVLQGVGPGTSNQWFLHATRL